MSFKGNKDFIEILMFLLGAALVVYLPPSPLNRFLFLLIYPVVWYSKRDYFWLAFFFLLTETPGGFFKINTDVEKYKLFFTISHGLSFTFNEVYLLLMLAKVIVFKRYKRRKHHLFFRRNLRLIAILFLVLVLISPMLGVDYNSVKEAYKIAIKISLFYTIFRIIPDMETFKKFIRILLPFTFIALLLQIYSLTHFHQLAVGIFKGMQNTQGIFADNMEEKLQRPIELVHVLLINFTITFYLLYNNMLKLSKNYLWVVNILSFISVMMTATRTWFIAFVFSYVLFLFLTRGYIGKWFVRLVVVGVFVSLLTTMVPVLNRQLQNAWMRLETVQMIVGGDLTAGGTAKRFDKRAPKVMNAFKRSSIVLGAGFSKNHHENQDFHVGYHNLLLNTGILGVIIFFLLVWKILVKSYHLRRKNNSLAVASIILVAILILNTATQFIGFNVLIPSRFYIQAYTLLFISLVYRFHYLPNEKNA